MRTFKDVDYVIIIQVGLENEWNSKQVKSIEFILVLNLAHNIYMDSSSQFSPQETQGWEYGVFSKHTVYWFTSSQIFFFILISHCFKDSKLTDFFFFFKP